MQERRSVRRWWREGVCAAAQQRKEADTGAHRVGLGAPRRSAVLGANGARATSSPWAKTPCSGVIETAPLAVWEVSILAIESRALCWSATTVMAPSRPRTRSAMRMCSHSAAGDARRQAVVESLAKHLLPSSSSGKGLLEWNRLLLDYCCHHTCLPLGNL